jgi:hypothetical protein
MYCGNAGLDFSDTLQNLTKRGGASAFEAGAELNHLFHKLEFLGAKTADEAGEPWTHFFEAADIFERVAQQSHQIPLTTITRPRIRRDIVAAALQPELEDHLLEATSSLQPHRYVPTAATPGTDVEIVMRILFGPDPIPLNSLGKVYQMFALRLRDLGSRIARFVENLKKGNMPVDEGRRILADWERVAQTGRFIGTLLDASTNPTAHWESVAQTERFQQRRDRPHRED